MKIKQLIKKSIFYRISIEIRNKLKKAIYPIKLYIAKIDKTFPSECGITDKSVFGDKKLIVSLTTFPARIPFVSKTICSLMHQSVKPNMIILWLSKKQFPSLDKDLSLDLLRLTKFGLMIRWVEDDIRSYKKLIPALESFPDDVIITADDDLYYPTYWIESLMNSYLRDPENVHSHCSTEVNYINNQLVFTTRYHQEGNGVSSNNNKLLGGSGTLYPPHILHKDVTNKNLFMKLAPTCDDIWFWAMALANHKKVKWIQNNMKSLYYVEGSQENSACLSSINDQGERLIDKQTKTVFEYYGLLNKLR